MLVSYSSFFGVRLFQFILVILVPLDVEGADVETTDVDSLDVERTDVGSFDVETVDEMGAGVFSPSSIPSMFCNTLFVLWSISRTCDNIFLKASSIFRVIFACSEVISLLVSEIIGTAPHFAKMSTLRVVGNPSKASGSGVFSSI